jgi:hypothetical protein
MSKLRKCLVEGVAVIAVLIAVVLMSQPASAQDLESSQADYRVRDLVFDEDLRHEGDVVLSGVWSFSSVSFGIPGYWELGEYPELHVVIRRSSQLIEHISSITVKLNGTPIQTIPLEGPVDEDQETVLKLPLDPTAGYHVIEFMGYHRSHLPCELTNHPGLWSRVLDDSFIRIRYKRVPPELDLAAWPYPLRDDRDPDQNLVTFVLPPKADAETLQAAGYLASFLGHAVTWRPMDLKVWQGSLEGAPKGNLVVLSSMDGKNTQLEHLRARMAQSGYGELNDLVKRLSSGEMPKAGVIAVMPRADDPSYATYSLIGRDSSGLLELARLMSNQEGSQLPTGMVEWVDKVETEDPLEPRRWERTVPPEISFTLEELGMDDIMASGARGGIVSIPLSMIPDDHPVAGQGRVELVYSYTAQASQDQSRIDVLLNGAAAGGVALSDVDGRNRARLLLDLPVHEMGPASHLDIAFRLVGLEQDECLGEWFEPMWGTVHSDTRITLPRDRWAQVNDLSLLRFGGYPFGVHADLADTLFVLRDKPALNELQIYLWLAAELGRVTRGDRYAYQVVKGAVDKDQHKDFHLVVVDSGPDAGLLRKAGLLSSMSFSREQDGFVRVALAGGGAVALGADPAVAYFESFAVPWAKERAALVVYAVSADLFERVGPCLHYTPLFERLSGKVTRVSSCADLAAVASDEIRYVGERPIREAAYQPIRRHYWWLLLGLVVFLIGVLVVRTVWLAPRRRELV